MLKYTGIVVILGLAIALASEEEQGCHTVVTQGGTKKPEKCVFPFTFRGKRYEGCTTEHDPDKRSWCSVQVDEDGNHVSGKGHWGHCDQATCTDFEPTLGLNKTCHTVGGNVKVPFGTPCVFPFVFRGVKYSHCTRKWAPDGVLWCSTRISADGEHVRGHWAHCHHSCPSTESTSSIESTTTTSTTMTRADAQSPKTHLPTLSSNECQSGMSRGRNSSLGSLIGGRDAKIFQYPFMALIGFCRSNDIEQKVIYGCGGSLINKW